MNEYKRYTIEMPDGEWTEEQKQKFVEWGQYAAKYHFNRCNPIDPERLGHDDRGNTIPRTLTFVWDE